MDVSNHSGEVSDLSVQQMKQEFGVGYAIIGIHMPQADLARRQTDVFLRNGVTVPGFYDFIYIADDNWHKRREVCRGIAKEYSADVWLNLEPYEGMPSVPSSEVRRQLHEARNLCRDEGIPTGMYTRLTAWVPMTGHTTEFSDGPLWDARYVLRFPPGVVQADDIGWSEKYATSRSLICNYSRFEAYGGWERPLLMQVAGTTQLNGESVDLNWAEPLAV